MILSSAKELGERIVISEKLVLGYSILLFLTLPECQLTIVYVIMVFIQEKSLKIF